MRKWFTRATAALVILIAIVSVLIGAAQATPIIDTAPYWHLHNRHYAYFKCVKDGQEVDGYTHYGILDPSPRAVCGVANVWRMQFAKDNINGYWNPGYDYNCVVYTEDWITWGNQQVIISWWEAWVPRGDDLNNQNDPPATADSSARMIGAAGQEWFGRVLGWRYFDLALGSKQCITSQAMRWYIDAPWCGGDGEPPTPMCNPPEYGFGDWTICMTYHPEQRTFGPYTGPTFEVEFTETLFGGEGVDEVWVIMPNHGIVQIRQPNNNLTCTIVAHTDY